MRGRGLPVSSAIYRINGVMKPPPAIRIFRVGGCALESGVIRGFKSVTATTHIARPAFTEGRCGTREPRAMAFPRVATERALASIIQASYVRHWTPRVRLTPPPIHIAGIRHEEAAYRRHPRPCRPTAGPVALRDQALGEPGTGHHDHARRLGHCASKRKV